MLIIHIKEKVNPDEMHNILVNYQTLLPYQLKTQFFPFSHDQFGKHGFLSVPLITNNKKFSAWVTKPHNADVK